MPTPSVGSNAVGLESHEAAQRLRAYWAPSAGDDTDDVDAFPFDTFLAELMSTRDA
jgi:hypothetical protein